MKDRVWTQHCSRSLHWLPERGMGYYPVQHQPYNQDYFDKYVGYAQTQTGRALTQARIDLVARHYDGPLVDVGIGCGQFVERRPFTQGYDVNPAGVEWLQQRGLFCHFYFSDCYAASFWDSLEHIPAPHLALDQVRQWAFVSIPIFDDAQHVLRSKHFRRDEHFWYFTEAGFLDWMADHGFECVESSRMECDLGREDIMSFALRRVREVDRRVR